MASDKQIAAWAAQQAQQATHRAVMQQKRIQQAKFELSTLPLDMSSIPTKKLAKMFSSAIKLDDKLALAKLKSEYRRRGKPTPILLYPNGRTGRATVRETSKE